MTSLALARQFRQLSESYNNRPLVAKSPGVVSGLLSFLEVVTNRQLQLISAETLDLLSENPESASTVALDSKLESALRKVFTTTDPMSPDGETLRQHCVSINSRTRTLQTTPEYIKPRPREPMRESALLSRIGSSARNTRGGLAGIIKTTRIQVDSAATDDDLSRAVKALVGAPGVLSVTRDPTMDRVLVLTGGVTEGEGIKRLLDIGLRSATAPPPAPKTPVLSPSFKGRQLTVDGYVSPENNSNGRWFRRVGRRLWQ